MLNPLPVDISQVHKILVIKLRAIGDVLLSTAVLPDLRKAFPDAAIDFLTEKPSRQVVEGNPEISSAIVYDGRKQNGAGLIADIRGRKYDLVIDLFGNPRSALVTLFSGARYRVGYRFGWRRYCYNIVVTPRGGEVHNIDFNLDALRAIGIPVGHPTASFTIDAEAEAFAERFYSGSGLDCRSVVALNPGGGWYTKRWPSCQYVALGGMLAEKYNTQIIVLWGPGEQETAREIISQMRSKALLIPAADLKQLAAIIKQCAAMVTNDSGPMHIAAAVGTPVLAIFGPTIPDLQGPVGDKHVVIQNQKLVCLGCNDTVCPIENPCMEQLDADVVFRAFGQLVEKNRLFHQVQSTS